MAPKTVMYKTTLVDGLNIAYREAGDQQNGTIVRVPEQRRAINGASNAEINRELTTLKRMFSLAIQAGKLLYKPYIPLPKEQNVRTGFF
jgi:hypothetical protein